MLQNPQIFLLWVLLTVIVYWSIPASAPPVRRWWLVAASLVLIFALAPRAAAICVAVSLITAGWTRAWHRYRRTYLLWVAIATVVAPLVAIRAEPKDWGLVVTLGLGFFTLKSVSVVVESYRQ